MVECYLLIIAKMNQSSSEKSGFMKKEFTTLISRAFKPMKIFFDIISSAKLKFKKIIMMKGENFMDEFNEAKKYLDDANRDGSDFGVEALLNFQSGPKRWREDIEAWINVGASHVSMRGMALRGQGEGLKTPHEHIKILETYGKRLVT